jgi:hypothetical protein
MCIRVLKRLRALKKQGYPYIIGLANRVSYGTEDFDHYSVFQNTQQLEESVKLAIDSGVSIIDYSNEPDWPVAVIRKVINEMGKQNEVKLVVDLHDLDSVRKNYLPKEEREMFNASDAVIYVSQPIQEITNELHSYDRPNIVLYSYCNDDVVNYDPALILQRHGLVYEGGSNPPQDEMQNQMYAYRNLYWIMKRLVELGNETHCFLGNLSAYDTFQQSGAVLYPPTQYDEMMHGLTKFKYGIVIFNNEDGKKDQVNYTLTNKAQEYLQAGLPSLACWCKETEKWVAKHKIGFTFNHVNEITPNAEFHNHYLEVMDNIHEKRKELVMERFIWKLENLYATLLDVEKKGIPENILKLSEFEYDQEDFKWLLQ